MGSKLTKHDPKAERLRVLGVLNRQPERVLAPWFALDTFFDPRDWVQVKYEMLRLVHTEGASKANAAALFGVSRPTFYQAEAAFDKGGLAGLMPRQRGPKGAHKLDQHLLDFIAAYQHERGPVGARDLADVISKELGISVHPRSIERAVARKKKRQAAAK